MCENRTRIGYKSTRTWRELVLDPLLHQLAADQRAHKRVDHRVLLLLLPKEFGKFKPVE